jgi:hypothetical protein
MTRTRLRRTLLRTAVPAGAVLALALAGAGTASADTVAFTAYDTDVNGYYDTYGFDGDHDGYEDTFAYDYDENGYLEQVGVDSDGDGWEDTWAFDEDEDGYVEAVGVDTTGNGAPDVWGADLDLDGYVDTLFYDVDDDGYADYSEIAGDYAYAYETVSYVFVESDGWVYWEATYESGYGYDYLSAGDDEVTTGDAADAAPAATSLDAAAVDSSTGAPDTVREVAAHLFGSLFAGS